MKVIKPTMIGELVQSANKVVHETRLFTLSEVTWEFPESSQTIVYKIMDDSKLSLHSQVATFFDGGTQKVVQRCDKCFDSRGLCCVPSFSFYLTSHQRLVKRE